MDGNCPSRQFLFFIFLKISGSTYFFLYVLPDSERLWACLKITFASAAHNHRQPQFLCLSAAEQVISQYQTADNKNQSREGFRNKQQKRHSDPKAKQHQSKDPLHKKPPVISFCCQYMHQLSIPCVPRPLLPSLPPLSSRPEISLFSFRP